MKKLLGVILAAGMLFGVGACQHESDTVSVNISVAADSFEVLRRVVFYNGITGEYMLTIEGYCALGNHDAAGEVTVVCKVAPTEYKKHFLGLSDNVTYFVEQISPVNVSAYHYRVVFKPSTIIPDIDIQ